MNEIKSLADQLRSKIAQPDERLPPGKPQSKKAVKGSNKPPEIPAILKELLEYDNTDHKSMVHARFDEKTVQLLNHFKMATGVDVTKMVAFAVRRLFAENPELKLIIQQFIQNLQL